MFETYYSKLFILLIIPLSFFISYLHYRNLNLPISQKILLILLRFSSISLISILLLFPVVRLIEYTLKENKDIILIDNSLSLKIEGRDSLIKQNVFRFVKSLESINKNYDIYLFSGYLSKKISKEELINIKYDSIDNFKTNIDLSINQLLEKEKEYNINSINIFTDGIVNEGTDILAPSYINSKINYFIIGDEEQKPDLVINKILFNKYSFISAEVPIIVKFSSYKLEKNVKINLYEEDKLLNSLNKKVFSDETEYEVVFKVKSDVETIKRYKIEIEPDSKEITQKNNYKYFYIKFIPNRFNVLVIAGSPSPDLSFLKNQINKTNNIKADYLTQKNDASFYEGNFNSLKEYSCVIFFGFPTSNTRNDILEKIKKEIADYQTPIYFFAARYVDYEKLKHFEDYLPFKINNGLGSEIKVKLEQVRKFNENYLQGMYFNFRGIENFPELFYVSNKITPNPSSEIYLSLANEITPVFLVSNTEKNKSAAFCAYGLYTWRLNPQNINYEPIFNSLLVNTISTLYDYEKQKLIIVQPLKDEFSPFENVIIKTRLNRKFDEKNKKILLRVYNSEREIFPTLISLDENHFESKFKIDKYGDYYSEASIENIEIPELKDNFRFLMGENNFEFNETRAREDYLLRLSNLSNGVNLKPFDDNQIKEFFKEGSEKKLSLNYFKNIYLNYNPIYIIILIILLSLEWFFRKKFNLP
ncbi:MAG: hypothetical protein N2490_01335 [Ignavibacteria bacterium]|nr:hypothetical protein [Ignavibacteria bacterium]